LESPDYSFGDKLLHRLTLGIPAIARVSFELDRFAAESRSATTAEKHVFISGLARSGTTILMRTFYDTGRFRSLTYRDMPFVLMPCTWKKLSSPFQKARQQKERAHGDGIFVGFDSPEAFEEVFWRVFCSKEYIFETSLGPHAVSDEVLDYFRIYVQRIISCENSRSKQRYLSKNNNNILRLDAIRRAFPESLIIIPFRNPVQHACSLLAQHMKFCEIHSQDRFSYDYMYWLGHHEFGLTHKAFRFSEQVKPSLDDYTPENINYWLTVWIITYSHLLSTAPAGSRFICYESLCNAPADILGPLFDSADVLMDWSCLHNTIRPPRTMIVNGVNADLANQAQQVYEAMQKFMSQVSS